MILRLLKDELEEYLSAYYMEAPEDAQYPYAVFELNRLTENYERQAMILEVNVWDKHKYFSRAEAKMDDIEKLLHGYFELTNHDVFYCFNGSRMAVPDDDKQIKRIREQFELYYYEYERKEETS